ncbi:MAG TPA: response regulator [Geothrix sp.]|nr:response regulator [Geothrix sp.]
MHRIAIVDDSRLVRAFAAAALRAKGFEVVEVAPTSLFEVLNRLRENPLDLLVVDVLMPECPGETLVRAVREDAVLKDLPILVVSAHRDDTTLQTVQQLGISGFLLKPVDAATLAAKVTETIEA